MQGIQGHQALDLTEEHTEDALRFQTGLQLQAQLLAQLSNGSGAAGWRERLAEAQTLQFGCVEINCVGLGRCFHNRSASKSLTGPMRVASAGVLLFRQFRKTLKQSKPLYSGF
jgi:hypothetical protein